MLPAEAEWIGRILSGMSVADISPVLDLGSSTEDFRRTHQPHIHHNVNHPLQNRQIPLICCDQKGGKGVDIVGDIYEPSIQEAIRARQPKCILCCNLLEHVLDRSKFAAVCDSLLRPGGYLLVTAPRSYPVHDDPIDTYFRPLPEEVSLLFPEYGVIAETVITDQSYREQLLAKPGELISQMRSVATNLFHPSSVFSGAWRSRNHRLLWLFRRYKVTGVFLRKIR